MKPRQPLRPMATTALYAAQRTQLIQEREKTDMHTRGKYFIAYMGLALLAVATPAQAQTLVTNCSNGTFTWTYIFDLAHSTVDMEGSFSWKGHANISEDKITWSRPTPSGGEYNVLNRYSGVLYSRNIDRTSTWNCNVAL
jgi:hypothetical protein